MRLNKYFIISLFLAAFTIACEKDEDDDREVVPPRDRGEQQTEDQKALEAFLETHFYNYEEFENPPESFDYVVRFDTISGANADKQALIESDLLESKTITRHDVDYQIYILKIREGVGEEPTFADSTFVTYNGQLLNLESFDNAVTPIWFDLPGYLVINQRQLEQRGGTVTGFTQALTEFRGASGFEVNPDNTVSWNNDYGIGAVFLPSGLGYFNRPQGTIPAYSPLVFSFQLYSANEADHDHDGIPSYMEDLNADQNLYNDDTDEDNMPNHSDADDDADVIPTREEIEINEDGTVVFPDKDDDGTPDYLDPDN